MSKKEELEEILNNLSICFDELVYFLRTELPPKEQRKYFCPETLGDMSCFLSLGNGWEPAYYNGKNIEDLLEFFPETPEDGD